jgi:hypothetical protein
MRWIIHPEVRAEVRALEFCRELLAHFDTSSLDWVRIDLGRGRIPGAYGRCWYPTRKPKKGYRISIQVPGPFPYNHLRYIKPLYQNDDGSWPPIPLGEACRILRSDPEWSRSALASADHRIPDGEP